VPEEVAIVGVDNSLLAVDAMKTPISSVDTNLELVGYIGAALLDKLMKGGQPPSEPIRVPPRGLITRKSSDILAVPHQGVARSLRYLWQNFNKPITVDDLAKVAGMSRRSYHEAFVKHVRRTPGEEVQRVRIEYDEKIVVGDQSEARGNSFRKWLFKFEQFCCRFQKHHWNGPRVDFAPNLAWQWDCVARTHKFQT